jgi:hypothetical protein
MADIAEELDEPRVPTLVEYAQRGTWPMPPGYRSQLTCGAVAVAGLHSECMFTTPPSLFGWLTWDLVIDSLGTLRFDLIQPILEKCTAEQLEHFEDTSPVRASLAPTEQPLIFHYRLQQIHGLTQGT